jgi:membrane-bound ClpP family serine protease
MSAIPVVTIAIVMGLLVVGLALAAVELFVVPGFGLIGVLGIAAGAAAVVVAITGLDLSMALAALGGGVVGGIALGWGVARSPLARAMVLDRSQRGSRAVDGELEGLVGAAGIAVTPLRPSGTARIGERNVDVVSQGVYVEAGAPVRVIHVQGARVVVEPAPSE